MNFFFLEGKNKRDQKRIEFVKEWIQNLSRVHHNTNTRRLKLFVADKFIRLDLNYYLILRKIKEQILFIEKTIFSFQDVIYMFNIYIT